MTVAKVLVHGGEYELFGAVEVTNGDFNELFFNAE